MNRILLSALLLVSLSLTCFSQEAAKQIANAASEVEQALVTLNITGDLADQCSNDVRSARADIATGNTLFALNTIRTCWLEVKTRSYAVSKNEKDVEQFEADWTRLGELLTEKEKQISGASGSRVPALAIALADATQIQARPYYRSGRLYGLNSSIPEGYYYFGRAPANLDFALFCRQLRFAKLQTPIKYRSLEIELAKLEADTLAAYRASDVNTQQPQYNRVNSNLKIAGELNTAAKFEAAFNKYLESILYLRLITAKTDGLDMNQLRAKSKDIKGRLSASDSDNSIGRLYLQMAQKLLEKEKPSDNEVKRAAVLLDFVLPAYFAYLGKTQ